MKIFIIMLLLVVASTALQVPNDVKIFRYDSEVGVAGYNFAYELSDDTKREEQGELRNAGTDSETYVVRGSYTWVAPNGVTWVVTFVADENGFRPEVKQDSLNRGGFSANVVASLLG